MACSFQHAATLASEHALKSVVRRRRRFGKERNVGSVGTIGTIPITVLTRHAELISRRWGDLCSMSGNAQLGVGPHAAADQCGDAKTTGVPKARSPLGGRIRGY